MPSSKDKPVPLARAAQTLYGTRSPDDGQIQRVFQLMATGVLPARSGGADPLKWTTTEADLAEFMAQQQLRKARKKRTGDARPQADGRPSRAKSAEIERVYQGLLRDYFLAFMLRRRVAHRSRAFRRTVVIGQVVFLLLVAGGVLSCFRGIRSSLTAPAEHHAVERWIEAHTDAHSIEGWYPTEPVEAGDGLLVCVKYRYRKDSPRWIHTERTFIVDGETVTEAQLDD